MEQTKRIPLLAFVALLHLGFLYLLQIGSLQRAAKPEEPVKEMVVEMIAPEPPQPPQAPVKQVEPPPPSPPPPPKPPKPTLPKPVSKPIAPAINPTPAPKEPTPQAAPVETTPAPSTQPPTSANPAEQGTAPAQAPRNPTRSKVRFAVKVEPEYPRMSKRLGETGKVTVLVYINASGLADPDKTKVVGSSGYPRLDQAALDAALRSRYVPAVENDKAVSTLVDVPYVFDFKDAE